MLTTHTLEPFRFREWMQFALDRENADVIAAAAPICLSFYRVV